MVWNGCYRLELVVHTEKGEMPLGPKTRAEFLFR